MISLSDIKRVNAILDREISLAEIKNHNHERQNLIFVQEKFREACLHCAKAEGLITSKTEERS